jgi:hypothetical protein
MLRDFLRRDAALSQESTSALQGRKEAQKAQTIYGRPLCFCASLWLLRQSFVTLNHLEQCRDRDTQYRTESGSDRMPPFNGVGLSKLQIFRAEFSKIVPIPLNRIAGSIALQ